MPVEILHPSTALNVRIRCNLCDSMILNSYVEPYQIADNKQFSEMWAICIECQSKFKDVITQLVLRKTS